ncbi:MAG: DUF971 domain-containing protein [Rhodospirillaceae bacterium]|nr:DUF971 domain-containing protein [Rhodospirillaceae bacterium]
MSDNFSQSHRAVELRVNSADKALEVDFENGVTFSLPAELLRVESPSAEVQGHSPSQKKVVAGRRHVGIIGVEPVGNYAVSLQFDDLHNTGIYSWDTLYQFGENQDAIWQGYLKELEKAGLSREP